MLQSKINATVVADSISHAGVRLTSFKLHYPRFIHSEFMTHRQFSRNASSSRAIPIARMIEQVENDPAVLAHYGKNQPGMQASEELSISEQDAAEILWLNAARKAAQAAGLLNKVGLHKQGSNRILEPFQYMNVIVTATEWKNFFELRAHADAQPEIRILAEAMLEALNNSTPVRLEPGEWHLPFIQYKDRKYWVDEISSVTLEDAKKISASVCAQVSYRKEDLSLEKARNIWEKLINSKPIHASPVEHQATPIQSVGRLHWTLIPGVTHKDRFGNLWSGNFKGWIQHRQLIDV